MSYGADSTIIGFMNAERIGELLPQAEQFRQLLVRLRQEQIVEGVPEVSLASRAKLLADFKKTPNFLQTYRMAVRHFAIPHSQQEMAKLMRCFAGRLFGDMAYLAVANSSLGDGEVMLSGERTLQFYERLFPDRRIYDDPFDTGAIEGVSVPDGLGLDADGRIAAVYEYSSHGDQRYFDRKEEAFIVHENKHPGVLGGAYLKFVTPTFSTNKPFGHTIFELPFTHPQLRDFGDSVYFHFRLDNLDSATLEEIQKRVWEQVERGRGYAQAVGVLPRPYAAYLRRFSEVGGAF